MKITIIIESKDEEVEFKTDAIGFIMEEDEKE